MVSRRNVYVNQTRPAQSRYIRTTSARAAAGRRPFALAQPRPQRRTDSWLRPLREDEEVLVVPLLDAREVDDLGAARRAHDAVAQMRRPPLEARPARTQDRSREVSRASSARAKLPNSTTWSANRRSARGGPSHTPPAVKRPLAQTSAASKVCSPTAKVSFRFACTIGGRQHGLSASSRTCERTCE
jgi:hypothetical protein